MFTTLITHSSVYTVLLLFVVLLFTMPHLLPFLAFPIGRRSLPLHLPPRPRSSNTQQRSVYSSRLSSRDSDGLKLSSFSALSSSFNGHGHGHGDDDDDDEDDNNTPSTKNVNGDDNFITADVDEEEDDDNNNNKHDMSANDDMFPSAVRVNPTVIPHDYHNHGSGGDEGDIQVDRDGAFHGECPEGYSLDSVILAETGTRRDTCLDLTSVSPVVSACEDGFVFTSATRACHNFTCYLDIIKERPSLFESYDDYIDTCFREECGARDGCNLENNDAWLIIQGDVNIFRLLPLYVLKGCAYLHDSIILGSENLPIISIEAANSRITAVEEEDVVVGDDKKGARRKREAERGDGDDEDDGKSVRPFKATTAGVYQKYSSRGGNGHAFYSTSDEKREELNGAPLQEQPAITCIKSPECPEFAYRAGGHCVVDCPTNFKLVDNKCVGEHVNPVCPDGAKLRPSDFLCENMTSLESSLE